MPMCLCILRIQRPNNLGNFVFGNIEGWHSFCSLKNYYKSLLGGVSSNCITLLSKKFITQVCLFQKVSRKLVINQNGWYWCINLLFLTHQCGDTRLSDYLEDRVEYKLFHYYKNSVAKDSILYSYLPFQKKT